MSAGWQADNASVNCQSHRESCGFAPHAQLVHWPPDAGCVSCGSLQLSNKNEQPADGAVAV